MGRGPGPEPEQEELSRHRNPPPASIYHPHTAVCLPGPVPPAPAVWGVREAGGSHRTPSLTGKPQASQKVSASCGPLAPHCVRNLHHRRSRGSREGTGRPRAPAPCALTVTHDFTPGTYSHRTAGPERVLRARGAGTCPFAREPQGILMQSHESSASPFLFQRNQSLTQAANQPFLSPTRAYVHPPARLRG